MSWYKVVLSNEDVSADRHILMQNEFAVLLAASGAPRDAGLFASRDPSENVYFFSPGANVDATVLIERYGAVGCCAPMRSDVSVLVANGLDAIPFSPKR